MYMNISINKNKNDKLLTTFILIPSVECQHCTVLQQEQNQSLELYLFCRKDFLKVFLVPILVFEVMLSILGFLVHMIE